MLLPSIARKVPSSPGASVKQITKFLMDIKLLLEFDDSDSNSNKNNNKNNYRTKNSTGVKCLLKRYRGDRI